MDETTTAQALATDAVTEPLAGTPEPLAGDAAKPTDTEELVPAKLLREKGAENARLTTKHKAEIQIERDRNAALEAQLATFRNQEQARADAELSELERVRKQAETAGLERQKALDDLRKARTDFEFDRHAAALNFKNPARAQRLIDGEIEYDAAGRPSNVRALLEALAESDPYLIDVAAPAPVAITPPPPPAPKAAQPTTAGAANNVAGVTTDYSHLRGEDLPKVFSPEQIVEMLKLGANGPLRHITHPKKKA